MTLLQQEWLGIGKKDSKKLVFVILCQTLSLISVCVTSGELQHRIVTSSHRIQAHVTLVVFLCTDFIRYIPPKIEQSLNEFGPALLSFL